MSDTLPLPYTASPYALLLSDFLLWLRLTFVWPLQDGLPSIIRPILPYHSGQLDELYPSLPNLWSLALQLILSVAQAGFLLAALPAAVLGVGFPFFPPVLSCYTPVWFLWVVGFVLLNKAATVLLNGSRRGFVSRVQLSDEEKRRTSKEKWVYVNGVTTGSHWMQSNLDRLALSFRREIHGVHNQTRGLFFDLVEVILERTLTFATTSTRMVYSRLMDIVSDPQYEKIVIILHSAGAVEGGLALDWLFTTASPSQLSRIEVFTFGSAANHFNNPPVARVEHAGIRAGACSQTTDGRMLKYIEHYANSGEYVARFGILNYRPIPHKDPRRRSRLTGSKIEENRYVGRLFLRQATGHLLNTNYLDYIFPMNDDLTNVLENNLFMDGIIDPKLLDESDIVVLRGNEADAGLLSGDKLDEFSPNPQMETPIRVKDVSRLWQYRNGGIPQDQD